MELPQKSTHLFALGIDERVFKKGPLQAKVIDYGRDFLSAHIVCRTTVRLRPFQEGGINFYPLYSRYGFLFPVKALGVGVRLMFQFKKGKWLMSADNPFETGLVCAILALAGRGKLYMQVHTDFLSPLFYKASWKEWVRSKIAMSVIRRADCVRVVSERIRRSLVRGLAIPESRISVLPIATDVQHFINASPDAVLQKRLARFDFVMVAVGRFVEKEKNFIMLIEAVRALVPECPRIALLLVGDGSDAPRYRALIATYGLEKHVMIEPWRNDLASLYKTCDLFLMSSWFEGWGRVVVEAMAAGLPVIMTDVGLAGEIVRNGENGIVVPLGNSSTYNAAVSELYHNPEKRKRLAEAGQNTVRTFPIQTDEEYFRRYRELLGCCIYS